jgi:hypothetical protein
MSCGLLLCLGLSTAAQADDAASVADKLKADQSDRRQGGQEASEQQVSDMQGGQAKGDKTIKGEVLRVEGDNYFVKGQDDKEVRMHTDKTTLIMGNIRQGDRIEANVNDQNHALSIRSARGTDAGHGNEAGRTTDSILESGKWAQWSGSR